MKHPNEFMAMALEKIESSPKHLIGISDVGKEFSHLTQPELIEIHSGYSTHACFEMVADHRHTYRLKRGYSASDAIENLFTNDMMVIECGMAVMIAYYYAILHSMISLHGEVNGKNRFDTLFGSKTCDVPIERRMMITQFGVFYGINPNKTFHSNNPESFQPLLPLFSYNSCNSKSTLLEKIQIGSFIIFVGDPNYVKIHPLGSHGAYNCIVTSVNPLKVRTRGINQEISEEELYQIHIKAYNEMPSSESISKASTTNLLIRNKYPETSKISIPGFNLSIVKFDDSMINKVLTAPLEVVLKFYELYIENRNTKVLPMKSPITPNPSALQATSGNASPLKGGWWASKPASATSADKALPITPAFEIQKKQAVVPPKPGSNHNIDNQDISWFKPGSFVKKGLS